MEEDTTDYSHEKGAPCPVLNLAIERFGEKDGIDILYNCTCFPFNDNMAMKQLKEIIVKVDAGVSIGQIYADIEADMERQMAALPLQEGP